MLDFLNSGDSDPNGGLVTYQVSGLPLLQSMGLVHIRLRNDIVGTVSSTLGSVVGGGVLWNENSEGNSHTAFVPTGAQTISCSWGLFGTHQFSLNAIAGATKFVEVDATGGTASENLIASVQEDGAPQTRRINIYLRNGQAGACHAILLGCQTLTIPNCQASNCDVIWPHLAWVDGIGLARPWIVGWNGLDFDDDGNAYYVVRYPISPVTPVCAPVKLQWVSFSYPWSPCSVPQLRLSEMLENVVF